MLSSPAGYFCIPGMKQGSLRILRLRGMGMSYRIVYSSQIQKMPIKRKGSPWVAGIAVFLILALCLTAGSGEWLQDLLLPGDAAVTGAALQNMVEDLKNGENLTDAVTAFCKEILDNAEHPK